MKTNLKYNVIMSTLVITILASCAGRSSGDYSSSTNASPVITKAETALSSAHNDQVDVFAPESYKHAMKALSEAKEERADDSNNETILKAVQETEKLTSVANQKSMVTKATLPGVAKARQAAIDAQAAKFATKEFNNADEDLVDFAKDIEKGKIENAGEATRSLLAQYRSIQVQATRSMKLNPTEALLKKAIDEGAEDNAPISFKAANDAFNNAKIVIEKNPTNFTAINPASEESLFQAEKLLRVTREAKAAGGSQSEPIILKGEAQKQIISKQKQGLSNSKSETALAEAQTTLAEEKVQSLTGVKNHQDKIATLSQKFNNDEADVYQQGNNVIIRLKGMQFPNNKAEIPTNGYATLKKVQEAILMFESPKVQIEGHTDATGNVATNMPLSQRRAESVKEYLSANLGSNTPDLEVTGYGSDKPLATNKTPEGRAQNRRIDVVIEEL